MTTKHEYFPAELYEWDAPSRDRLRAALPLRIADLVDPDGFGRGLSHVADDGERRLYALGSKVVWATIRGDVVVDLAFPEGRAALDDLIAWQWHLPAERIAKIVAVLRPGASLERALDEAFGPRRIGVGYLGDVEVDATCRASVFLLSQVGPSRCAVLDVTVDGSGCIANARVLEGSAGWERMAEMLLRNGRWPRDRK